MQLGGLHLVQLGQTRTMDALRFMSREPLDGLAEGMMELSRAKLEVALGVHLLRADREMTESIFEMWV